MTILISPDQFFGKYDQKPCDYDGSYGNQCVDLYRAFVKECKGFPQSPPVGGAYEIWTTYLTQYFDRIGNTTTNCPIKGDIVIWGQEIGSFGHVAVCKDGTPNSFTSFDQNWPSQGYIDSNGNFHGTGVCHFQAHNYNGVLGWLREKTINNPTPPEVPPVTPPEMPPVTPPVTPETPPATVPDISSVPIDYKALYEVVQAKYDSLYNTFFGKGWWFVKWAKLKTIFLA